MNARTLLSTKWVLSHLFVVAMVALMVSLGFWQLSRLEARRADNEAIRAVSAAAAVRIEDLLAASSGDSRPAPDTAGSDSQNGSARADSGSETGGDAAVGNDGLVPEPPDHTPVIVTGSYLDELSFLVANRTFGSRPGYWLATPVRLDDGRLVVVARGWVPRGWVSGDDPRSVATPAEVQLGGRAFSSVDGGRVGSSIGDRAVVSRVDLAAVEQALGVDVAGIWVQLERQAPVSGELPIPVPRPVLDDGPHLAYAFQWFFFSAGTVVVYWLILRRRVRAQASLPDEPHEVSGTVPVSSPVSGPAAGRQEGGLGRPLAP